MQIVYCDLRLICIQNGLISFKMVFVGLPVIQLDGSVPVADVVINNRDSDSGQVVTLVGSVCKVIRDSCYMCPYCTAWD